MTAIELPLPGTRFEQRYEIDSVLGEGGFARVYKARDIELGRTVALKVIAPKGGEYSDVSGKRFHREAQLIASLQDPHTITLFDYGESREGLLYMAFEFVDGDELKTVITRCGGLPPAIVAHILMQLLSSLDEAHRCGVLHRDLKPQNVLVYEWNNDPYRVKLLDFGIAKRTESADQKITRTGALIGTPRYMSPEQVVGEKLTPQSDIFSLGLLAIEMLAGSPAIQGATVDQLLAKASLGMFTMPQGVAPSGLVRIIEKMCAPEPERRYPSARAVMNALREVHREVLDWTGEPQPPPAAAWSSQEHSVPSISDAPASASQSRTIDQNPGLSTAARITLIALTALAVVGVGLVVADRWFADEPGLEEAGPPPNVGAILKAPDKEPARRNVPAVPMDLGADPTVGDVGEDDASADADTGAGCSAEAPFTGPGVLRPTGDFVREAYDVYIPGNYEPGERHPMLVLFHDVQQTGSILKRNQMDLLAEEMGMVVLMPSDPDFSPWWGADDLERTIEAIDAVQQELCIDPKRVFAYGHGAGGRIAERLTCDFPQIAATATMSFRAKPREAPPCRPQQPKPHLHIATLQNGYVPVAGGKGCGMTIAASLDEYQRSLRRRWGCQGERRVWKKHRDGACYTWSCDSQLISCEIDGGREWPGTAHREWDQLNCDGKPSKFPYRKAFRDFFESVR